MTKVAVIGSGSWGTAISHLLGRAGNEVKLWSFDEGTDVFINEHHKNPIYLKDVELPNVWCSRDYGEVLDGVEGVVVVTPSVVMRSTANGLKPYVSDDLPIVVLSKGIEEGTGFQMAEVLADVLGNPARIAAMCGPNHAEEVSRDLPAATVVAAHDEETAKFFQELFTTDTFRVYTSTDLTGVELCSAAKNIIAIANGMLCAMELGDSASASLITRGLAEMTRLVVALGGEERTCMGLAGLGDLVVTCTSKHSRNRSLGELLVQGGTLEEFQAKTRMVAEGAVACKTVTELADKHGVDMPIAQMVRRVLWEGLDPRDGVVELLSRPLKPEFPEE